MEVYKLYKVVYKMYAGVYKVYMGVSKIYIGVFVVHMGVYVSVCKYTSRANTHTRKRKEKYMKINK